MPILVGGHVDAHCAARRCWATAGCTAAARRGARPAAHPARGDPQGGGRTRDDFEIHVDLARRLHLDGVKRLEDKGVTDCIVGFRVPYIKGPDTEPLEKKIDNLNRYADSIISKAS